MGATKSGMVEDVGPQGQRQLRLSNWHHGGNPTISWLGGRSGYLWVGNDSTCFFWLSTTEARRLRDLLNEEIGD